MQICKLPWRVNYMLMFQAMGRYSACYNTHYRTVFLSRYFPDARDPDHRQPGCLCSARKRGVSSTIGIFEADPKAGNMFWVILRVNAIIKESYKNAYENNMNISKLVMFSHIHFQDVDILYSRKAFFILIKQDMQNFRLVDFSSNVTVK